MKSLIVIFLVLSLSMLSLFCKRTTEDKMIEQINKTSLYGKSRIIKIDVIDTIYQDDVNESMRLDTLRLEFLREKYELFDSLKNEIRKIPRSEFNDTHRIKHNKGVFDSLMMYDRWIDMTRGRKYIYQRINNYSNNKTDVSGYRVIIHYKDGRMNDFVIESDYSVLCPSFMLQPNDSIMRFDHNKMKRPNREKRNGIQQGNSRQYNSRW